MINFPLIERLSISDYALYPSDSEDRRLDVAAPDGLLIVLGVNGLGKSTLLLIARYLMTGPIRARKAGFAGERSRDLSGLDRRFFAARVSDEARESKATIEMSFGTSTIEIERRLSDLSFVSAKLTKNDRETLIDDEQSLHAKIAELMQLERFEDVVGLLDRVTFFLENRDPLLWDLSAQFEVFRAILTPTLAQELRQLEGSIISADSSARNLNATIHKIVQKRLSERSKTHAKDATKAKLAAREGERDALQKGLEKHTDTLDLARAEVANQKLALMRAEHSFEDAAQKYEKIKFEALRHSFAGVPLNQQYVFLKIISEQICIACGNNAESAADELVERQKQSRCLVCGSKIAQTGNVTNLSKARKDKAESAYQLLVERREEVSVARQSLHEAEQRQAKCEQDFTSKYQDLEKLEAQIRALRRSLPSEDLADMVAEENRILALRAEVMSFRKEREEFENKIDGLLVALSEKIATVRLDLESRFRSLSHTFFAEEVRLVYSPRRTRIGQQGRVFSFPAFEVEMTSGATLSDFVRREQDQVSLSQRDYLDIIFRMAIIDVFSSSGGSLVVDGPEGSVDAVFAEKAGDLFSSFASSPNTNAILACNIVEGGFIPHALKKYKSTKAKRNHLLNLLSVGAPTAALRTLRPEYDAKIKQILSTEVTS